MPGRISNGIGEFKDGVSMNVPWWNIHVAWWALLSHRSCFQPTKPMDSTLGLATGDSGLRRSNHRKGDRFGPQPAMSSEITSIDSLHQITRVSSKRDTSRKIQFRERPCCL